MSFESFSHLAGTWGLLALLIMFIIAITYAFWPSNQEKFRAAANLPLDDQEENHS